MSSGWITTRVITGGVPSSRHPMHRRLCLPGGRTCAPLQPLPTSKGAPLPDDSPREALPVRPEWHDSVSITTHRRLLARTFVTTLPCLRNRPPLSPDTEAPAGPRLVLTGYNNGTSTNRRRPLRYRALPQVPVMAGPAASCRIVVGKVFAHVAPVAICDRMRFRPGQTNAELSTQPLEVAHLGIECLHLLPQERPDILTCQPTPIAYAKDRCDLLQRQPHGLSALDELQAGCHRIIVQAIAALGALSRHHQTEALVVAQGIAAESRYACYIPNF